MRRFIFTLVAVLSLVSAAFAVEPDEVLPDPTLEARARVLSKTLRCMVCQNQSIDDSNAPLAREQRLIERLRQGHIQHRTGCANALFKRIPIGLNRAQPLLHGSYMAPDGAL